MTTVRSSTSATVIVVPMPAWAASSLAAACSRQARGDLAGLRAAHAVGDGEERRLHDVGVLVPAPLATGVGRACHVSDAQLSNLKSVSPIRTTSPGLSLRGDSSRTPFTE